MLITLRASVSKYLGKAPFGNMGYDSQGRNKGHYTNRCIYKR